MMDKLFLLSIIFTITIISSVAADENRKCVKKDACHCEISDYEKIDISKLLDDKPLKDSELPFTYYFYGCNDTEVKGSFFNPKLNGTFKGSLFAYNGSVTVLGSASQLQYESDKSHYEIVYKKDDTVTASILLICDTLEQPYIKVIDVTANRFALSSTHACILTVKPGNSTGSVLVILFIVTCIIYFFGGALLLYFFRGARGIEMIPNVDFWRDLPGLIKDGTIFIFSGCRVTHVSTAETYDRI